MPRLIWRQPAVPPVGTTHRWDGDPYVSESIKEDYGAEVDRNRVTGPDGDFGWFYAGGVRSTPEPGASRTTASDALSARGLRVDQTSSQFVPATPGETAHFQCETRGVPITLTIQFRNAENTYLSTVYESVPSIGGNDWDHLYISGVVPEGAVSMRARLMNWVDVQEGDSFDVRRISDTLDYFDGDSPDDRADDVWVSPLDNVPHVWDSATHEWVQGIPPTTHFHVRDGALVPLLVTDAFPAIPD